MIRVRTPAGKRALGESLKTHAPAVLTDITMLSKCIGGTSEVYVELDDAAAMAAVSDEMDEARAAHVAQVRADATDKRQAASREISAMREILGATDQQANAGR